MYGGSTVVGLVVDHRGVLTSDAATALWNGQNPSYQGDGAEEGRFVET